MHELDTLYELCETISRELEDVNEKIRKSGSKLSTGDLDVVDKLTHSMKSLKTTIAMIESNSYNNSGDNSYNSYNSYERSRNSNARGRSNAQQRDSMGRYSRDSEMISMLDDYARKADNPMKRREIESFMERIQNM